MAQGKTSVKTDESRNSPAALAVLGETSEQSDESRNVDREDPLLFARGQTPVQAGESRNGLGLAWQSHLGETPVRSGEGRNLRDVGGKLL